MKLPDAAARLVAAQRPQLADLPVTPLPDELERTDHVLSRIGNELAARMPKIASAVDRADSDARWLPLPAPCTGWIRPEVRSSQRIPADPLCATPTKASAGAAPARRA
jgi:hypothetical protein